MQDKPFQVDCVAVAAVRLPPCERDDPSLMVPDAATMMRAKIETIFKIALEQSANEFERFVWQNPMCACAGHTQLVLSAFGCGAFRCPPDHVAHIFKAVLQQYAGR